MSASKQAALRAAAVKVLQDKVKEAANESRADVQAHLDPGDRTTVFHDGRKLGTVQMTEGRRTAKVTDPDRLAAWLAEHYPHQVQHKPVAYPAFVQLVLNASKDAGQPCAPEGELDVPGVAVHDGDPYPSIRLTGEAEQIVADMVRAGLLDLDGTLRQIEAGA